MMTGNEEDESADTQAITSPLDHIRHEEAEVAGRLVAARRAVDERLAAAREKADELKEESRRAAQKEAEDRRSEIIVEAKEEAEAILAQARQRAEALREGKSEQQFAVVEQIVAMIAGMDVSSIRGSTTGGRASGIANGRTVANHFCVGVRSK